MQPHPPPYSPPPGSDPPVQQPPPGTAPPQGAAPSPGHPGGRRSHADPARSSKVLAAAVGAGALVGLMGGMAIASAGDDAVATTPANATLDPDATPSPPADGNTGPTDGDQVPGSPQMPGGRSGGPGQGDSDPGQGDSGQGESDDSGADQWGTPPSGRQPGVEGLPGDGMTPPSGSTGGSQ